MSTWTKLEGLARRFIAASAALLWAATVVLADPAPLTTVAAIKSLPREQAARQLPVRVTVAVTMASIERWRFFAQDATGAIYFRPPDLYTSSAPSPRVLRVGQIVTLEGRTDPGRYSPLISVTRIIETQQIAPPEPRDITVEDLDTDRFECQRVRLRARVTSALSGSSTHQFSVSAFSFAEVILKVRSEDRDLRVLIDHNLGLNPTDIIGAEVSITGVAAIRSNGRAQRLESILIAQSTDNLKVLRLPPQPAFDQPLTSMAKLFAPGQDTARMQSVRVSGMVTYQEKGVRLIVQEGNHAVEARTQQWVAVNAGATVEVVGKPRIDGHAYILEDAVFREIPRKLALIPFDFQASWLKDESGIDPQNLLSVIEGVLVDQRHTNQGTELLVQQGRILVRARLHVDRKDDLPPLEIGSFVRVRGVCSIAYSGFLSADPSSFEMLLASKSDVTVLRRPPWWNTEHSLEAFGSVLLAIFASTFWGLSLRQRVREKTSELRHLAMHDALTELPNRRFLDQYIDAALPKLRERQCRMGIVCLDLDRFKQINETLGHRVGDCFLQQVAVRLRSILAEGETLARKGGDEFVVLLPQIRDQAAAEARASEFLQALEMPVDAGGTVIYASTSIGISLFPDHGNDAVTLLQHADQAMFAVKKRGGMDLQTYSLEMASAPAGALAIERAIRASLGNNTFELHYQPQYRMDGVLVGMEALLRLRDDTLGWISPAEFIPIAEKTGLIVPIGNWVLEEACRQLAEWRDAGLETVPVGVNVSAPQFRKGDLPELVRRTLASHGLSSSMLELEITESIVVGNSEREVGQIREIRASGVHIAIDDFGTGYSSLSTLHHLPIDRLKIDRAFVKDLGGENDSTVLVRSVIALAHAMGMNVLAEGVETEEQRQVLLFLDCQYIQGYLFSRPLPAAAATALLERAVSREAQLQLT